MSLRTIARLVVLITALAALTAAYALARSHARVHELDAVPTLRG
jgi:ABC-type spermidine/putrescine transport system permease subunit I